MPKPLFPKPKVKLGLPTKFNPARRGIIVGKEERRLSHNQWKLFVLLWRNFGRPLPTERLALHISPMSSDPRHGTVVVGIWFVRKKIRNSRYQVFSYKNDGYWIGFRTRESEEYRYITGDKPDGHPRN